MFKTTKVKVIFTLTFCIICISVTFGLILYKNIEIGQEISDDTEILENAMKSKDFAGINLKGTYNQNDIKIEEKRATKENIEINYEQISGLKNKIIQENINREIEKIALNYYREEIDDLEKVVNVFVYINNTANFANTLSFEVTYVAKINDDDDGFYQGFKGINYDLTTGNEITIDKLFTSDAPMENILRNSVYYSLIQNNVEENLSGDFVVADYGDIEGEISTFINQYKKNKIKEFRFSPKEICIFYEKDKRITIDMRKYADYIAIYNRYLTDESIFERNDIGLKNLYTLSERYIADYRYTNYEKENNYFIDINIDNTDGKENIFSKKLLQEKIKQIDTEVEKVKLAASRDISNFYILNYYISINTTKEAPTQQNLTCCVTNGNSYEMTIHDFEENIEPIIIKYNRMEISGAIPEYIYDFNKVLKVEPQKTVEYYNTETGEKIVI